MLKNLTLSFPMLGSAAESISVKLQDRMERNIPAYAFLGAA